MHILGDVLYPQRCFSAAVRGNLNHKTTPGSPFNIKTVCPGMDISIFSRYGDFHFKENNTVVRSSYL